MKNYLEHNDKVKYVDGLLAHSQQWQWFIDLIQDTFEITAINSWNEYESCNRPLQDVFGYFIKIQEVSDGSWSFSRLEFSELWEIARYFLGKDTFAECSSKITTIYGKLMLFCTWITKLGNASQTPPTAHIYDIRILNQKNYFQLIDLKPYLVEEAALLEYADSIEINGFDEPINCLRDNLSETEHAFSEDFFLQNDDKLLNYNAISFQTIRAQPYATWQERYLLDMVRVNINGNELQPQFVSGNVIIPDTALWQVDCLAKMKAFFNHKTADFLIDTISLVLHGTALPKETKLTHVSLLLNALKGGETKSDIFHSSSFRVVALLFETRSLKDCATEACYIDLLKELHSITDALLIIRLKENGFPVTKSQIEIANEYYQSKYKEIDNIEEAYDLTRYLCDCDNPISIDSVHLETVRAKFDRCVESTEGIIISSLFYKYMVFLLQVNERNQNANKQWVHAEMIRTQALWQNELFDRQANGMYTYSHEHEIPTVEIERFTNAALANPIYFAHQCIPCSTQKIIEIMQCTSEHPLLHMVNVMYNSNSFNVRNECIHGRDFLSGPSLRFAMTVTLFSLHMIIFRINTIKENVSDILELPE